MPSVVVYARISTTEGRQHLSTQVRACKRYAETQGYTVRQVYQDEAGATDYGRRTAWRQMLKDLSRWHPRQRPQAVVAFALDRFIRSVRDYVDTQARLGALGVALVTVDGVAGGIGQEGDEYRTLQLHILAAFAEFERALIRRRVKTGVDRARAEGKRLGRPYTAIDWEAWAALPPGLSERQRAQALGVARSTLIRAEKVVHNPPDAERPVVDTKETPKPNAGPVAHKEMIVDKEEA